MYLFLTSNEHHTTSVVEIVGRKLSLETTTTIGTQTVKLSNKNKHFTDVVALCCGTRYNKLDRKRRVEPELY